MYTYDSPTHSLTHSLMSLTGKQAGRAGQAGLTDVPSISNNNMLFRNSQAHFGVKHKPNGRMDAPLCCQ